MSTDQYDPNFTRQLGATAKRVAAEPVAAPDTSDPTFAIRRKQANLCDAVMLRVQKLEAAGNAMLESAKKLRAAVLANT